MEEERKIEIEEKRENEKRENKKSEQDEVIIEKEEMKLQIENCLVNSSFPIITNSLLQEPSILGQRYIVTHNLVDSRTNLLKERGNDAIQHGPPMGSIKVIKSLMFKKNTGPFYHDWADPNKWKKPLWSDFE